MLWSLPVVLEPPSARWLEEVTEFVVSALMDVSVGDIFGTVAKCPNSEGSVLRQFFGCGDAVPSQQLFNISPTVDDLSMVKFEDRDSCEFDTVVFSVLSDDCFVTETLCASGCEFVLGDQCFVLGDNVTNGPGDFVHTFSVVIPHVPVVMFSAIPLLSGRFVGSFSRVVVRVRR